MFLESACNNVSYRSFGFAKFAFGAEKKDMFLDESQIFPVIPEFCQRHVFLLAPNANFKKPKLL